MSEATPTEPTPSTSCQGPGWCDPYKAPEQLCAVCRISLQVGGPVPMPERPEGAYDARHPDTEFSQAGVYAQRWALAVFPDGQCSLSVPLGRRWTDRLVSVSARSIDLVSMYETLHGALLPEAEDRATVPTPEQVRAALGWCRAALTLAEGPSS